jgi:hypothetical protein
VTPISNIAASIHQRLLNKAMAERRPFNELLQYYAIERFLFRLGQSSYGKQFVLKGALVFLAWQVRLTRPTRDMDFLGFTENSIENLVHIVQEICTQTVDGDGILFDPQTVEGAVIKEDAEYSGVRVAFLGYLGKAKINMRLDVGFADVVTPHPNEIEFQTILEGSSKPCIRAYPPETVIAEKFQAMVDLGMANSRLKDFYDLWFMASTMEFDYGLLMEAITTTFKNRGTPFPESTSPALTEEFAAQKQVQWVSFLKKSQIVDAPTSLYDVIQGLTRFFTPLVNPNGEVFRHWSPTTGWFK